MKKKFSPEVKKNLQNYVYIYIDPRDGEIFYVGHGKGNRCFNHLEKNDQSKKSELLQKIKQENKQPIIEILVHGLEKETARIVESSVIDLLGISNLTNRKKGYKSNKTGRMSLDKLRAHYSYEKAEIEHKVILFYLNQSFAYGMEPIELYDATRGVWADIKSGREEANYSFAVYNNVVREVYKIEEWFPAGTTFTTRDLDKPDRFEFVGNIAREEIRQKYLMKSVKQYITPQRAFDYVNF